MNKRSVGNEGESRACDFLLKNGIIIKDRNFHFHRMGEIDIIGFDGKYLVFFEVKMRAGDSMAGAAYAVNFTKQKQISKVALGYLTSKGFPLDTPMRFDVIAIDGDEINWIKNAFEYVG